MLGCLGPHLSGLAAHSILIDKRELGSEMQRAERLYPAAFSQLMESAMAGEQSVARPLQVIVATDALLVRRQRLAVKKAVKLALHERARDAFEYRILHHSSRVEPCVRGIGGLGKTRV